MARQVRGTCLGQKGLVRGLNWLVPDVGRANWTGLNFIMPFLFDVLYPGFLKETCFIKGVLYSRLGPNLLGLTVAV